MDIQAVDHRRKHRVGRGKITEEKAAGLTKFLARRAESAFKALNIGGCPETELAF
jgi:hypothetical protein